MHTIASPLRGALLANLRWPEAEQRLTAGARPVLTIGAGAKEHGHHLPLGTDAMQAAWLGQALAARHPVLVWPVLSYGHYPAFLAYPGSVSLGAQTFGAMVEDILASIARHTRRAALIINTGISTIAPLEATLARFRGPAPTAVHVYHGARLSACAERLARQHHGGHGDEVETSVMLALAPDQVSMKDASPYDQPMAPGALQREPGVPNYTPQGVWGNPARASRENGIKFLGAMLDDLGIALAAMKD